MEDPVCTPSAPEISEAAMGLAHDIVIVVVMVVVIAVFTLAVTAVATSLKRGRRRY